MVRNKTFLFIKRYMLVGLWHPYPGITPFDPSGGQIVRSGQTKNMQSLCEKGGILFWLTDQAWGGESTSETDKKIIIIISPIDLWNFRTLQ